MARRSSYGSQMALWEQEKDLRDWQDLVRRAVQAKDYGYLVELIIDGLRANYDIPDIPSDTTATSIIETLKENF